MFRKINYKFAIIAVLFLLIQAWILTVSSMNPFLGIKVEAEADGNKDSWYISGFKNETIGKRNGLQVGDRVVSIDGLPANDYKSVIKWHTIDQAKVIVLQRQDETIRFETKGISVISSYDLLAWAGELICLASAALLLFKLPKSKSAIHLALVFLNGSIIFMSYPASIKGDALSKAIITDSLFALPIVFLHFLIVFFKEKASVTIATQLHKKLYRILLLTMAVSALLLIDSPFAYYLNNYMGIYALGFFTIFICYNFVLLFQLFLKYRRSNPYVATVIKTVWFAIFLSFMPFICFSFLPRLLNQSSIFDYLYMSGFVFLFPLSFAYLIASKKLYDIDFIVRRIVLTGFISLVPTGLIVLIACLFFKTAVTLHAVLALFVLVLVIQTLVLYLLEFFTTKLEPVMFPHKHQLQSSLKKLTRNLSINFNLRELRDVMLLDVVQTFQVHGGAIVFQYPDKLELISEGEIDTAEVEALIAEGVMDHPTYSIYEVNRHDEFTSYLILTQKKSKTLIGVEEQQWLNIIISYLAVSLENVYLIRKLSLEVQRLAAQIPNEEAASELNWFRKLMFELQESERVRIATELHDTTMQDLFFLKERFAQLIEKYALSADDKAQLQGFIDYIDIINANLRQSCFELHPHLLREIGLVGTIEELVSFEEAVSSFSLEFRSIRKDLIESQDMEMKRHVFRMVQELINNAKKHSQAKSVWLSLEAGNQILRLEYEDNGVGFDMNQPKEKEIGNSGIGMEQMKGRVLSLNGRFQLESSIGAGMRFTATIPLKEGKTA